MNTLTLGIHLILLPEGKSQLPQASMVLVGNAIQRTCKKYRCSLFATAVRSDHVHVLLEARNEVDATNAIAALADSVRQCVQSVDALAEMSSDIHITLIPPWHLEVMASFVRDQELFHSKYTVDQEITTIFMPHATPAFHAEPN